MCLFIRSIAYFFHIFLCSHSFHSLCKFWFCLFASWAQNHRHLKLIPESSVCELRRAKNKIWYAWYYEYTWKIKCIRESISGFSVLSMNYGLFHGLRQQICITDPHPYPQTEQKYDENVHAIWQRENAYSCLIWSRIYLDSKSNVMSNENVEKCKKISRVKEKDRDRVWKIWMLNA